MPTAVIILAAGLSSRMGKSKQLLTIEGEPLLRRTAKTAIGSRASHTVVVVGSEEPTHRATIEDLPVSIATNPDPSRGMGSSIKVGLHHLLALTPALDSVVIMLCDQPGVTSQHINLIIAVYETTFGHIVASEYSGVCGVPALFDKEIFPALLAMTDEGGAKTIIQKNIANVTTIPFPEGVIDLDTPEDYETFLKS
jgi:molybdenum cofactor cytidylyltransferase